MGHWPLTTQQGVDFNRAMNTYRRRCQETFTQKEQLNCFLETLRMTKLQLALSLDLHELLTPLKFLCAQNKCDVGLIKGVRPVEIIPKSQYRPCKEQYLLKRGDIKYTKQE